MTFTPKNAQRFQSMPDNSGAIVMVATNAKPGEDLSFKLIGQRTVSGGGPAGRGRR